MWFYTFGFHTLYEINNESIGFGQIKKTVLRFFFNRKRHNWRKEKTEVRPILPSLVSYFFQTFEMNVQIQIF